MNESHTVADRTAEERWLKFYYFLRAAFSFLWVAAAFTVGKQSPSVAAALLVSYPAWDALANLFDASRAGGLARNRTQAINVLGSTAAAIAVVLALPDMNLVLAVYGAWAIVSGLMQSGTAVRRWKAYGAQWAMILSGLQSALAGTFFIVQSQSPTTPSIGNVAGYAAFGAFYFLVSAVWLTANVRLRKRAA